MSRLNTIARRLAFGALVSACSFGVFAETSPITDEQKKNAEALIQKALKSDLGYSIVES
ncbi:MAG TPA: peptidase M28 family protein, partial [Alteromonas macleodii]|nr:peptidase M28 family protein [Alteromonas macleodii]HAX26943.1 peptidase M28 family protein [Alteromonas macleodii]HCG89785.1 peptidase M28 family protein [Alteromonas macleodii]